jgi:hypothetical protein
VRELSSHTHSYHKGKSAATPRGAELMREQFVLVRGDDQPVGNPKRKV